MPTKNIFDLGGGGGKFGNFRSFCLNVEAESSCFFFSIFCFLASSTPYNAGSQRSKKRASENVLISFSPPLFWLVFWSILHHWFVTSTQPRNIISFFFKNENFSVFDEFFWSLFFILFISKFQTLKHHQENNFFFHNISKKLEFTFFYWLLKFAAINENVFQWTLKLLIYFLLRGNRCSISNAIFHNFPNDWLANQKLHRLFTSRKVIC